MLKTGIAVWFSILLIHLQRNGESLFCAYLCFSWVFHGRHSYTSSSSSQHISPQIPEQFLIRPPIYLLGLQILRQIHVR